MCYCNLFCKFKRYNGKRKYEVVIIWCRVYYVYNIIFGVMNVYDF